MTRFDHVRPTSVSALARRRKPVRRVAKPVSEKRRDGLVREAFTLEREAARVKARAYLERWPREAYWTRVEHWRQLPDGRIEFTMARLPTAD